MLVPSCFPVYSLCWKPFFCILSFKALIKFIGRKVALMRCSCSGAKARPLRPCWSSGAGWCTSNAAATTHHQCCWGSFCFSLVQHGLQGHLCHSGPLLAIVVTLGNFWQFGPPWAIWAICAICATFGHHGPLLVIWATLGHFGPPWAIWATLTNLGHPRPPWAILATLGNLGHPRPFGPSTNMV